MTRDLVPTNACASSAIVCHITWASRLLAEARRDATDVAKPITSIPITVAACAQRVRFSTPTGAKKEGRASASISPRCCGVDVGVSTFNSWEEFC
jgi:hypothetical protein